MEISAFLSIPFLFYALISFSGHSITSGVFPSDWVESDRILIDGVADGEVPSKAGKDWLSQHEEPAEINLLTSQ